MKMIFVCLVLFGLGYGSVVTWQGLLAGWLEDNGCRVAASDPSAYSLDRIVGAVWMLCCYPAVRGGLALILSTISRKQIDRDLWVALILCGIFAHLGALLRAVIVVKINLQDSFANGEIQPHIDLLTLEISQWMMYGMLSALVIYLMVLVPIRLIADSED